MARSSSLQVVPSAEQGGIPPDSTLEHISAWRKVGAAVGLVAAIGFGLLLNDTISNPPEVTDPNLSALQHKKNALDDEFTASEESFFEFTATHTVTPRDIYYAQKSGINTDAVLGARKEYDRLDEKIYSIGNNFQGNGKGFLYLMGASFGGILLTVNSSSIIRKTRKNRQLAKTQLAVDNS